MSTTRTDLVDVIFSEIKYREEQKHIANAQQTIALNHQIDLLQSFLENYLSTDPELAVQYILKTRNTYNSAVEVPEVEKPKKDENIMTIVSVVFPNGSNTYDYEYVDDEEIEVGDYVSVETPYNRTLNVEVVRITQIHKDDAELDYKPAFYN